MNRAQQAGRIYQDSEIFSTALLVKKDIARIPPLLHCCFTVHALDAARGSGGESKTDREGCWGLERE